jgi:hypothetical protein
MNKKFQLKNCPLCGKLLKLKYHRTIPAYQCTEIYKAGRFEAPHYQVSIDGQLMTQQTILPPYLLKTVINSGRTQVYSVPEPSDVTVLNGNGDQILKFVMDIPTVVPEEPEKLRKRLKNLIIFS